MIIMSTAGPQARRTTEVGRDFESNHLMPGDMAGLIINTLTYFSQRSYM